MGLDDGKPALTPEPPEMSGSAGSLGGMTGILRVLENVAIDQVLEPGAPTHGN